METQTEILPYIQEALQKFELPDIVISQWKEDYMPLVVTDLNDKVQYQKVRDARLFVKAKRIEVEKRRKELKENSLRFGRAVDTEAKRLITLIEPIEAHLLKEEKKVEDERERIRAEKEKVEREKIQKRTAAMLELGMHFDGVLFKFHEYEVEAEKIMRLEEEDFINFGDIVISEVNIIKQRIKQAEEEAQKKKEVEEEEKRKREALIQEEQNKRIAAIKEQEERLETEKKRIAEEQAAKEAELQQKEKELQEQQEKIEKEVLKRKEEVIVNALKIPPLKEKEDANLNENNVYQHVAKKRAEWPALLALEPNTTEYEMFVKGYDAALYELIIALKNNIKNESNTSDVQG